MADANNTISTLNTLIQANKDGESGFAEAAQGVTNNEVKNLFMQKSQQRSQFASELQNEVSRLGGDPQTSGSVVASLHRGWIDIKSIVTGKDEAAILAECERGEESIVNNYNEALKQPLPTEVNSIIENQQRQILESHAKIRSLKEALSATA
ncbi:MAG: PA2169 family four-helix-bundle protein [Pyrinomonadaceae bacterium]|nr:PA2169 family four-helix-bundle protein [Pyrinomonadaceae bacterium]